MEENKKPSLDIPQNIQNEKIVKSLEQDRLFAETEALTPAQKIKDKSELIYLQNGVSLNLDDYVTNNYVEYYPHFPKRFFYGIAKLFGLDEAIMDNYKKPRCVPEFINRFIYGRFPNGVLRRIQVLNPFTPLYVRKRKNFQYLTVYADNILGVYIEDAIRVMEECSSYKEFVWKYSKEFKLPIQLSVFEIPDPTA